MCIGLQESNAVTQILLVGGHVEANLLSTYRLWVMASPCWEWDSNP